MITDVQTPGTFVGSIDRRRPHAESDRQLIATLCVSPPRSGHHLLTNYLFKYFSDDPDFADLNGDDTRRRAQDIIAAGPLWYCEHYHHCRCIPCVDPRVNLMKFHDRGARSRRDRFSHAIVQLRNPLLSTCSFYAFRHRRAPESSGEFVRVLEGELKYWRRFVEKWVLQPHPSRLLILYDDLMAAPEATLARAIRFIEPHRPIDQELLARCVQSQRVIRTDWTSQDALWSDARIRALEERLTPLLEAVGIEPVGAGPTA